LRDDAQLDAASLRFQPAIKRPNLVQKPKPRPSSNPTVVTKPPTLPAAPVATGPIVQKWNDSQQQDFDVVNEYHKFQEEQKIRLKEERKSKRSKKASLQVEDIDWSAPYNVQQAFTKTRTKLRLDAWKHSDSKFNARYQWKETLHSFKRPGTPPPARDEPRLATDVSYKNMPPPQELVDPPNLPATSQPTFAPPPPPPAPTPVPASYAPQPTQFDQYPPPPLQFPGPPALPGLQYYPPPPPHFIPPPPPAQPYQSAPSPVAPQSAPPQPSGTISREPVRYEEAAQIKDNPDYTQNSTNMEPSQESEPETRTSAPGQKGFAQRYMEKMGWKKGEGLGREATGITTILRHEATKRKRKGDAEGGGWAQPAAMGRIVGGKKSKTDTPVDETKAFSLVARFEGMLRDMDIDQAIEEDNLMQRIGEKLEFYGRSERVFIDRSTGRVFVKFTSALSAFNVSFARCCIGIFFTDETTGYQSE
jgi:splicing factor 45